MPPGEISSYCAIKAGVGPSSVKPGQPRFGIISLFKRRFCTLAEPPQEFDHEPPPHPSCPPRPVQPVRRAAPRPRGRPLGGGPGRAAAALPRRARRHRCVRLRRGHLVRAGCGRHRHPPDHPRRRGTPSQALARRDADRLHRRLRRQRRRLRDGRARRRDHPGHLAPRRRRGGGLASHGRQDPVQVDAGQLQPLREAVPGVARRHRPRAAPPPRGGLRQLFARRPADRLQPGQRRDAHLEALPRRAGPGRLHL